jgi:hypothetical protein
MSAHHSRPRTRHAVPWFVVCAWGSLLLVVLGGLAAATGLL